VVVSRFLEWAVVGRAEFWSLGLYMYESRIRQVYNFQKTNL
jgi:hypothetical protein